MYNQFLTLCAIRIDGIFEALDRNNVGAETATGDHSDHLNYSSAAYFSAQFKSIR